MPLPKPNQSENQQEFISRCMTDLKGEFPDKDQRLVICYAQWSEK